MLVHVLGAPLVALICGVHLKTVAPWTSGTRPRVEQETRLRNTLGAVRKLQRSGEDNRVIRAWFRGMNSYLDEESPARAVQKEPRRVLEAADAFVQAD